MTDHAREVRHSLTDPRRLCEALGLLRGAKRQGGGVVICCPAHGDRTPSCSVTTGPDGTIRVRCFACDFSADALGLIAQVEGVSLRGQFREVLARGAEIAGELALRDEILRGEPMPDRAPVKAQPPRPEPEYPQTDELQALWGSSVPASSDPDVWEYLRGRGIDSDALSPGSVRVVPQGAETPRWARFRGKTWQETGHRLLVAMWDAQGVMRSVRAWRIEEGDSPKRLPPAGCRATGLVMANQWAWMMLAGRWCPKQLVIVEGEPDWATASGLWADRAIAGIVTGSWTQEFGARVPRRTEVLIRTHNDDAGNRYAAQIRATVAGRPIRRSAA